MIVARNPASANRATSYAERLRLGLAVIHGEQKESESDRIDGRHSPPPVASGSSTSSQALGMPGLPCKYHSNMSIATAQRETHKVVLMDRWSL